MVTDLKPDVGEVVGDVKTNVREVVDSDEKADVGITLLGHHNFVQLTVGPEILRLSEFRSLKICGNLWHVVRLCVEIVHIS